MRVPLGELSSKIELLALYDPSFYFYFIYKKYGRSQGPVRLLSVLAVLAGWDGK